MPKETSNQESALEEIPDEKEGKKKKPPSPHKKQKDSWRREFKSQSSRLIYFEYDGPFNIDGSYRLEDNTEVIRLRYCNRSLGVIEGTILSYKKKRNEGIFLCEGKEYSFCFHVIEELPEKLDSLIGETRRFNFRPLIPQIYLPNEEPDLIPRKIRIEKVRYSSKPVNNYLEVTGKIDRINDEHFIVLTWDFRKRKVSYVPFWGKYPYPDELGEFAWFKGKFEPSTGKILFVEAESITFLTPEEAKEALQYIRKDEPKEEI